MYRNRLGFTLIEAVIVLMIASVLIAVAVPAVGGALARTRTSAARAMLLSTLSSAIGHAATTGTEVVLCPAGGTGCLDSMDWSGGWIAFADLDGDRRRSPGETLVRRSEPLHESVRLRSTRGRKQLVVQPNGGNAGSNVTFTLCDSRGAQAAITLVLANNGRLRAGTPTRAAARGCVAALR